MMKKICGIPFSYGWAISLGILGIGGAMGWIQWNTSHHHSKKEILPTIASQPKPVAHQAERALSKNNAYFPSSPNNFLFESTQRQCSGDGISASLIFINPKNKEYEALFNKLCYLFAVSSDEGVVLHDWLLKIYLNELKSILLKNVKLPEEMLKNPELSVEVFWKLDQHFNAAATGYSLFCINSRVLNDIEEEGALASIVGHELGHLILGHLQMSWEMNRFQSKNMRSNETAADEVGLRLVTDAGWDPEMFVAGMRAMQEAEDHLDAPKPRLSSERASINKYEDLAEQLGDRSHPVTSERITYIQAQINNYPAQRHRNTSLEFWLSKARMLALFDSGNAMHSGSSGGKISMNADKNIYIKDRLNAWKSDNHFYKKIAADYGLTLLHVHHGEFEKAFKILEELPESIKTHPWIELLRAEILAQQGKYLNPSELEAIYQLFKEKYGKEAATGICTEISLKHKQLGFATQHLETLFSEIHALSLEAPLQEQLARCYLLNPEKNIEAHLLFGKVHQHYGRMDNALKEYKLALSLAKKEKNFPALEQANAGISKVLAQSAALDLYIKEHC